MREFIEHTGLDSQPDFADFRDVLLAMEGNLFYPKIVMHDHSLKESLCVDMRRTKRIYDYTRTIKEIGSDMSPKQMKHMIASPFTDGNVVEGHTGCGYNNTVMAAYLAFKELGEKTSGNPKLLMNKLARAILKRIDDGERGPLDQRQFKDALNELRMAGIHFETKVDKTGNETKPAEDFLRALICGGADDTRETIGQALGGGNTEKAIAKIDERGYLVMPAMQAVEEIALELLPNGVELHAEHFDYLVTEEVTRRIIERYHDLAEKIGRESPLELNGRMADLHTNFAFVLAEHLPHSIDELFDMRRTRYYKPDKREAPGIDLNTSPYMSIEELHRFEKQKRRSA